MTSRYELTRVLGAIDEVRIAEILAPGPTLRELEVVAMRLGGRDDGPSAENRLSDVSAAIIDILTAGGPEPDAPSTGRRSTR
ncbi:hypothetical protein [Inquilinus sp. OTU3971]|uniref:hypothetical protein n=1 Tax=Inquilinus sp. OTU3971 TaxID=3043855 RepID=UPI00313BFBEC